MTHNIEQHTTCCKAATSQQHVAMICAKQDLKTGVEVNIKNLKTEPVKNKL